MIIYFIVFSILAFYAWSYQNGRINKISLFPFLLMLFLVALRDKSVGLDSQNYIDGFVYGSNFNLRTEAEVGFSYWKDFLKLFSKRGEWFLFATSCLSMIPLLLCIKKESPNPYLSLLLFLVYDGGMGLYMNASRQAIAISFCIIAFFVIDFKRIQSLVIASLIILIASTFHTSALLCFAYIAFAKIPLSNAKSKIIILLASVFIGLYVKLNLISYLPDLIQIGIMADKVELYSEHSSLEIDLNFNGLVSQILPITVLLYYVVRYMEDSPIQRICYWSVIFANVFANTPFLPRFFVYGILPLIILFPNVYLRLSSRRKIVVDAFIILMLAFFVLYSASNNGIDHYAFYI